MNKGGQVYGEDCCLAKKRSDDGQFEYPLIPGLCVPDCGNGADRGNYQKQESSGSKDISCRSPSVANEDSPAKKLECGCHGTDEWNPLVQFIRAKEPHKKCSCEQKNHHEVNFCS